MNNDDRGLAGKSVKFGNPLRHNLPQTAAVTAKFDTEGFWPDIHLSIDNAAIPMFSVRKADLQVAVARMLTSLQPLPEFSPIAPDEIHAAEHN